MRKSRDFAAIRAFFGDREIDELQAAADERREARALRPADPEVETAPGDPEADARPAGGTRACPEVGSTGLRKRAA